MIFFYGFVFNSLTYILRVFFVNDRKKSFLKLYIIFELIILSKSWFNAPIQINKFSYNSFLSIPSTILL